VASTRATGYGIVEPEASGKRYEASVTESTPAARTRWQFAEWRRHDLLARFERLYAVVSERVCFDPYMRNTRS